MTRLLAQLGLLIAAALSGCNGSDTAQDTAASAAVSANPTLPGTDGRAWLTPRGSMGEANYCAEALRLPLEREPAWRFGYTPAQFTDQRLQGLLHYDGVIVGYAACPSLILLEADSGRLIDFPFAYAQAEGQPGETLSGLMFSPGGRLLGHDILGRYYAWDLGGGKLTRRWLTTSMRYAELGYAAGDQLVYTGDNDGVTALNLASGAVDWIYPADRLVWNILLAPDGTLLCLVYPGSIVALESHSGQLSWSLDLNCFIAGVCTDTQGQAFFVATTTGELQKRQLASGSLDWSYDYSKVFSPAEHAAVEALTTDARTLRLAFSPSAVSCAPEALLLTFFNGSVLALSQAGDKLWQQRLDSAAIDCLACANALIVRQAYRDAQAGAGPPQIIDAFNQVRPDWSRLPREMPPPNNGEVQSRRATTYAMLRVLDLSTGEDLDHFEPEVLPVCGLLPAGSKIIFGGSRSLADRLKEQSGPSPQTWLLAYDWLEQGERH